MSEKSKDNPFLRRYTPFDRYSKGDGFAKQPCQKTVFFHTEGDSLTDKESYKLSLAAQRSFAASPVGSTRVGQYMYQDGKYDSSQDMSYIMRPDLTPQEIDRYIKLTENQLTIDRDALTEEAQKELEQKLAVLKASKDKSSQSDGASDPVGSQSNKSSE